MVKIVVTFLLWKIGDNTEKKRSLLVVIKTKQIFTINNIELYNYLD